MLLITCILGRNYNNYFNLLLNKPYDKRYLKGIDLVSKEIKALSDEELVKKLKAKKEDEVFEEFYLRYKDIIFNYIKKILYYSSKATIEEIHSEIFIKVYTNIEKLKNIKACKSWLFTIAHNECVNYIKSKKSNSSNDYIEVTETEEKRINLENEYENRELHNFIFEKINKLNENHKEIFIHKFYDNMTYNEISKKMKIPERTIKYKMKNILTSLGKDLEEEGYV